MKLIEKYDCILCKYHNNIVKCKESILNGNKCKTLSNIYYGKIIKWFPFNIIDKISTEINYKRTEKFYKDFNEDYTENKDMKFIYGIKSYSDFTSGNANLMSMNDLELIYLKKENKYILGVETCYLFENKEEEQKYFKILLDRFTQYMKENNYNINTTLNPYGDIYGIFGIGLNITSKFYTVEDAYRTFKYLVNGYLTLN